LFVKWSTLRANPTKEYYYYYNLLSKCLKSLSSEQGQSSKILKLMKYKKLRIVPVEQSVFNSAIQFGNGSSMQRFPLANLNMTDGKKQTYE